MDINKMTDTLELGGNGVGGLQLPGKIESFQGRRGGNRYSDEDVEKSYFADQETMEVGVSGSHEIKAESTVIQVEVKHLIQLKDPKDINKMTDTLEPDETGVGGLQLPVKDRVVFRPSERKSLL
ncbi:hypothetical protein Tco_1077266, partial [Tanacetum coccineum]